MDVDKGVEEPRTHLTLPYVAQGYTIFQLRIYDIQQLKKHHIRTRAAEKASFRQSCIYHKYHGNRACVAALSIEYRVEIVLSQW